MEQYTTGEPQEIVRSCEHMPTSRGFKEAKRLLQRHYGDELIIASAYVDKALKWPQIKPDDAKALSTYAMFLVGCRNAMDDVEFMEEMDNPTNMRAILAKLPYKMKERWRSEAYDIKERHGERARFTHLVDFMERQANVAMDPLFGNILETHIATSKLKQKEKVPIKKGIKKSSFATSICVEEKGNSNWSGKRVGLTKIVNAFEKPCIFCLKDHALESCREIKEQPHQARVEFLKSKGLCFGCLTQGHLSRMCKKRMECKECSQRHPDILHIKDEEKDVETSDKKISCAQVSLNHQSAAESEGNSCVLSIVPVKVKSSKSDRYVETYAFLDAGSTATFCTEELRKTLNLKGKPTQILLSTMCQSKPGEQKLVNSFILSDIEVCGLEDSKYIELPKVFTHNSIPVQSENVPISEDISKWPYLNEVSLPRIKANVGLLIGANNPKAMEPWHIINSQQGGPYAIKTALGWVVSGPLKKERCTAETLKVSHHTVNHITVMEIEQLLIKQYNTDFPERQYEEKAEMSQEDKQFMQSVQNNTKFENGHYHVKLPLKDETVRMPNNRCVAELRAANLKRKLQKNLKFCEDYNGFMKGIIEKGYAVKVPTEQINRNDGRVWYIPHHGMYHPKKNKIRVVFDCTASFQGMSLNNQLIQGPNLTNTLIGVLNRFREEPVAMMADVESMFYQVKVPEEDEDLLRFLWWPNGNLNVPVEEFRMTVHLFGATSSPSCASYALRRTAEDRKDISAPKVVETVLCNFYVDDCLKSITTEQEAVDLIKNVRDLCAEGGFCLTKWVSNSRKVLLSSPEEHRASGVKDLDLDQDSLPMERALGIQWCTESDTFIYSIKVNEKPLSRRGILSVVNSIYDPLGFLVPVILPAKLLLRDMCKQGYGWDEEIEGKRANQWVKWLENLKHLSDFKIQRCVKPDTFGNTTEAQMHHFSDASESAYGTASYLVLTTKQNQKHCALLMGKSRVSPLKQVTIPRLELTAAVTAVKMDKILRQELQIPLKQSIFWSDSTTVLSYIENESSRFKTFVANRISFIRDAMSPSQWRFVQTTLNPADQATRGVKAKDFIQTSTWINGPSFLTKSEQEWPQRPNQTVQCTQQDPEIKVGVLATNVSDAIINKLVDYYSDWFKLKKAIAWMLRFKETLTQLSKTRKQFKAYIEQTEKDPDKQAALLQEQMQKYKSTMKGQSLSLEEMEHSESQLIQYSQVKHFPKEIESLKANGFIKRNSPLYKLDPVLQDGIIRVGGRLDKAAMPEESKHPVILDKHSKIAVLILKDIHQKCGHCGRNYMLSTLRQRYLIPQANSAIRKLINKCTVCRRLDRKAEEQKMANLPEDRLIPDKPPFTNVGVDYFGPFEVKRGRSTVKRYGVLFTCLTIRAVHIEIADSLDTDSCINALRRFISRRGQVSVMRSDNGTNFVGAERELREALEDLNHNKIENTMLQKGIKWIFNSPSASHQGGVWERQIRTVRRILGALLKEQSMTDDSLHTIMCEVESIINNRPITSMPDDPNDLEPLTPNHLLLLKAQSSLPPGVFKQEDLYARKHWKQVQYLADLFWRRWIHEYLPILQERCKWIRSKRNLELGDVVLIVDSSSPRHSWLMGRVVQTLPDSSGTVRRVKIQTKTNVLERPINKLCLIQEAV